MHLAKPCALVASVQDYYNQVDVLTLLYNSSNYSDNAEKLSASKKGSDLPTIVNTRSKPVLKFFQIIFFLNYIFYFDVRRSHSALSIQRRSLHGSFANCWHRTIYRLVRDSLLRQTWHLIDLGLTDTFGT